jgi:glycerol-3-phosphate dehydrogenase
VGATTYDIAIVGGGINGCGIARDAAGRGLSVYLCDQGDLAGATSSASTKLIHGGLRYLEHFHIRLVRESLKEREVLLRIAPHIVHPLRFVLPHDKEQRPAWQIRIGLFMYDHLGGRHLLQGTSSLRLKDDPAGAPLKDHFKLAFEYSDCWVDDARLVVLNAMDAAARGAAIRPRTRCVAAKREGALWNLTCESQPSGTRETIQAKALINAAGPWVARFLNGAVHEAAPAKVRLVKGSHIVVPRLFDHDRAYLFQNGDGRIVFAIPFRRDFTLLGTTDTDFQGDPADVHASPEDIAYICSAANEYFRKPVAPQDVVWTYSGVRPLYDDGASKAQEATRDYVLELETPKEGAALVSIFGGKITTYRKLAEAVLHKLKHALPMKPEWTSTAALPGGDFPPEGHEALAREVLAAHPYLETELADRLVRGYGTRVRALLEGVRSRTDLGQHFGAGLYEREVRYLMTQEWARTAEDVLWRRSKLGLRFAKAEAAALDRWMRSADLKPAA